MLQVNLFSYEIQTFTVGRTPIMIYAGETAPTFVTRFSLVQLTLDHQFSLFSVKVTRKKLPLDNPEYHFSSFYLDDHCCCLYTVGL